MADVRLQVGSSYLRRWPFWLLGILLVLTVVAIAGADTGAHRLLNHGTATILAMMTILWLGGIVGTQLHEHVIRPGSLLIVGFRRRHLEVAGILSATVFTVPVMSGIVSGWDPLPLLALCAASLALGLGLGFSMPPSQIQAAFGFLAGLGLAINVATYYSVKGQLSPWHWSKHIDVRLQQVGLLLLALMLIALLVRRVLNVREDSFEFRVRQQTADLGCDTAASRQISRVLLTLMPPLGKRRIVPRSNGQSTTLFGRVQAWRAGSGPLRPLGIALFLSPLVFLLAYAGMEDAGELSAYDNPLMFMTNGVIFLMAHYSRERLKQEMMRPLQRRELLRVASLALIMDTAELWVAMIVVNLVVYLLLQPAYLSQPLFWCPYVLSPGIMILDLGVGSFSSRLGKQWGGLIPFFVAWPAGLALTVALREGWKIHSVLAWVAISAGLMLMGWGLGTTGLRWWQRTELR